MRLSAFDTYAMFLALKNHFGTESYDFFKYHGKTRASVDSFMQRRDRFHFQRLSRKYNDDQMMDLLVSNFIMGKNWVGDFLEDDANDNFLAYVKRKQSLSYVFANDLDSLFSRTTPLRAFRSQKGSLPPVLNDLIAGDISLETFVILNDFLNMFRVFDETMKDDFIWSKYGSIAKKYRPFLEYDKEKLCRVLKEKLNEYSTKGQEAQSSPSYESKEDQSCSPYLRETVA